LWEPLQEWWDALFPVVISPEEKLHKAETTLKAQESALMREDWMLQARLESCEKQTLAAAKRRNEGEIREAAKQRVTLENQRAALQRRQKEHYETRESVTQMRTDQVNAGVILDVMSATNTTTLDPVEATRTLSQYAFLSQQRDSVKELVREAMRERMEEVAEAEETEADAEKVEALVRETTEVSNQMMLDQMPCVNVHPVSSAALANQSKEALRERNKEELRKMDLFIAKGK
jgi:hypothetical protein